MGFVPRIDGLLNRKESTMTHHYETLFVVKPTLTEEEIQAQIQKVLAVLDSQNAVLAAKHEIGMRRLAYPVQKHVRGYYAVLYFTAGGEAIAEIERNLRINEEIIKFLTVKYTKTKEIAQFDKLVAAAQKSSNAKSEAVEAPEATTQEPVEA
jgi:small subunit ribosomal protein S6